jgi:hypothetical protein
MGTVKERADAARSILVEEIPTISGPGTFDCPTCYQDLLPDDMELGYDMLQKIRGWTVAQLVSWTQMQRNSGYTPEELLVRTSEQPRPGIGAVVNPTVLGVDLHGMFVGIEPDGYTHS